MALSTAVPGAVPSGAWEGTGSLPSGRPPLCPGASQHVRAPDRLFQQVARSVLHQYLTHSSTCRRSLVMPAAPEIQSYLLPHSCFPFSLTRGASARNHVLLRLHVGSRQLLCVHDFLPSLCVLGSRGKNCSSLRHYKRGFLITQSATSNMTLTSFVAFSGKPRGPSNLAAQPFCPSLRRRRK